MITRSLRNTVIRINSRNLATSSCHLKEDYRKKFEKKFTEYRTEFEKTPESFQILVLTFAVTSLVPKGLFNFGFSAWLFYNVINKAPYVQDVHYILDKYGLKAAAHYYKDTYIAAWNNFFKLKK